MELEVNTSVMTGMKAHPLPWVSFQFVLKRSMATGFAGVQNPLFFKDNTRMLFGDAKASISALVSEFKE